ncbi:MAG: hypothetical protein ABEJ72_03760, partial [Candidatus Aenigmatarchaeota archaeon]
MRVEKLLKRLRREFVKVNLIQASLDAILFFLSINLGLFLFDTTITSSYSNFTILVPATILLFIVDLGYRARNYRLELYEEKNPELQEILRTARDNLSSNSIVSQAMFDELMDRSRSVTSESIIPSTKIIQKILAVGILSFLTVGSGIADFQVINQGGNLLPGIDELQKQITGEGDDEFELKNGSEIYGNSRNIEASNELISFNITGEGNASNSDLGSNRQPEEIMLDSTGPALSEDLELAKKYSLAI